MVRVEHHPYFASQYEQLCLLPDATEIAGEVTQLLDALESYVTSTLDMFALRRTPTTRYTPYADKPPVLRIPYVWFFDADQETDLAVVMLIGDKTALGSNWYPAQVQLIESKLVPEWERANPTHRAWKRRH